MSVRDNPHFVSEELLPQLDMWTPAREVLPRLNLAQAGAFLIRDALAPRFYSTGKEFAEALDRFAARAGWDVAVEAAMIDVLDIHSRDGAWSAPLRKVSETILVGEDDDDRLAGFEALPEHLVFPVMGRQGRLQGWFLNHETLRHTIHTPTPRYRCSDYAEHITTDPDHGTCFCGGSLTQI